jgi:hypothetical protein
MKTTQASETFTAEEKEAMKEFGSTDAGASLGDILGAALNANEVQIWTDVDGVLTADPRIVPDARSLKELTYAEAADRMTQHIQDSVLQLHTDTANAIRTVSAGIDEGRGLRYLFSPEAPTVADAEQAGTITADQGTEALDIAEQLSPALEQEFAEASTAAGIVSRSVEDRKATARILGSSSNEMRDGIVVTTMRLYQGATVATVLEEKFEGDAKFMIGNLGLRKWMTGALREWERVTGDKLLISDDETVTNQIGRASCRERVLLLV